MLAEIDLNVILHLGRFRNVDLPTRGIYYIEAALYCGCAPVTASSVQITPIGMFSAPQTLDSFVKRQTLFPAPMLDTSQITEETKKFRTRQIVIRYLEEIHELNDGVHWRLTTPNVRIRLEDCEAPICLDVLHLRLELFCCPLLRDEKLNIMTDIELLLPNPASFESVASQSIEFQRATTGIHQYYPIRFDKKHCVEVDAMVHACVTAIRYKGLPDLNPGRKENDRSSFSNEGRHTLLDSSSSEFQAPEEGTFASILFLINS